MSLPPRPDEIISLPPRPDEVEGSPLRPPEKLSAKTQAMVAVHPTNTYDASTDATGGLFLKAGRMLGAIVPTIEVGADILLSGLDDNSGDVYRKGSDARKEVASSAELAKHGLSRAQEEEFLWLNQENAKLKRKLGEEVARNRAQQAERDRKQKQFEKISLKAARKEAAMNGLIQEERKVAALEIEKRDAVIDKLRGKYETTRQNLRDLREEMNDIMEESRMLKGVVKNIDDENRALKSMLNTVNSRDDCSRRQPVIIEDPALGSFLSSLDKELGDSDESVSRSVMQEKIGVSLNASGPELPLSRAQVLAARRVAATAPVDSPYSHSTSLGPGLSQADRRRLGLEASPSKNKGTMATTYGQTSNNQETGGASAGEGTAMKALSFVARSFWGT
eukprot:SAG31_NODE_610_length_13564_cov_3.189528_4_plen_392_part_00